MHMIACYEGEVTVLVHLPLRFLSARRQPCRAVSSTYWQQHIFLLCSAPQCQVAVLWLTEYGHLGMSPRCKLWARCFLAVLRLCRHAVTAAPYRRPDGSARIRQAHADAGKMGTAATVRFTNNVRVCIGQPFHWAPPSLEAAVFCFQPPTRLHLSRQLTTFDVRFSDGGQ